MSETNFQEDIQLSDPIVSVEAQEPEERMSEVEKLTLQLAAEQRKTALAMADSALANSEKAELNYKYVVLQIYHSHGLTQNDAISADGAIMRNHNGKNNK